MVLYDPQEFGGLEEYAVTLAIGLRRAGHDVSVLSTTWASLDNQYLRRLREDGVTIVQPPRWLSQPASHWPTKTRILTVLVLLLMPLIYPLSGGLALYRRCSWRQAVMSVYGRFHSLLSTYVIGPDQRRPLARLLLNWWRLRWRPDLLHIQGYTSTLLFVIDWAHAHGIPVVYEEHQTPDTRFDWWQGFAGSINKAAVVVAVSDTSARALRNVCGVTQPIVVRSPLLPDPVAAGWRSSDTARASAAPVRCTTVARLAVPKGLTYLLDAIVAVRATHPATQFKVYGDGELRDELLAYAARLGLDGKAIFAGPFTSRAELSRIMAETDIFVLSSILEGQPLAVMEAASYGRAIVTTAVGGIPEIIVDGANGLLCEPGEPQRLADKIRSLIEDSTLRAQLGAAARRTYERGPYQPAAVCAHFEQIYGQALRQHRGLTHDKQRLAPSLDG